MAQSTALSIGGGGQFSYFEPKNGYIYEKTRTSDTSAYMLVYVRDADRQRIMSEVSVDEIPKHLKLRFDEENMMNQKLDEDQIYLSECYSVHLVSFDIIRTWDENGFMQVPDDVYFEDKFILND